MKIMTAPSIPKNRRYTRKIGASRYYCFLSKSVLRKIEVFLSGDDIIGKKQIKTELILK